MRRKPYLLRFLPPERPGLHALLERYRATDEDDTTIHRSRERTVSGYWVYLVNFFGDIGKKRIMRKSDMQLVDWLEEYRGIRIAIEGDDEHTSRNLKPWVSENMLHYHSEGKTCPEIAALIGCHLSTVHQTLHKHGLMPNPSLFGGNQHGEHELKVAA